MAIAVGTLVLTGVVAEMGSSSVCGYSSLAHTGDSGGVVAACRYGGILHGMSGCNQGYLAEDASMLKVAVGDRASWVGFRDQLVLDFGWERETPHVALACGIEVHTAHAGLGCVRGPQVGRLLGDDFRKVCRPVAKTGCKGGEGVNVLTEGPSDAHTIALGPIQGELQGAEETCGARDGNRDEAKLAQDALKPLVGDPA